MFLWTSDFTFHVTDCSEIRPCYGEPVQQRRHRQRHQDQLHPVLQQQRGERQQLRGWHQPRNVSLKLQSIQYHFLQEFNVLTIFQRNQADAGSIEAFICNQSFWSSWGSSSGNTPKTQSPSDITMILESAKGSPQYMEVITIQFDGRAPAR